MDSKLPVWAIIPASGAGRRMQADRPKQYLSFAGKTVIEHTLDRLLSCPLIHGAILAINEADAYWSSLNYLPVKPLHVVRGGRERQDSVLNALYMMNDLLDDAWALVHDAVRPLVPLEDLVRLIDSTGPGGAILASPLADTLKRQDEEGNIQKTISREGLWRALTPQIFNAESLMLALEKARNNNQIVTDDASAMEALGHKPLLVEGSSENIKITRPGDLDMAELIWVKQCQRQVTKPA